MPSTVIEVKWEIDAAEMEERRCDASSMERIGRVNRVGGQLDSSSLVEWTVSDVVPATAQIGQPSPSSAHGPARRLPTATQQLQLRRLPLPAVANHFNPTDRGGSRWAAAASHYRNIVDSGFDFDADLRMRSESQRLARSR